MARWTEDTTFKFVEQYVQHECLWDVRQTDYKNKQKRQDAYIKLQQVMAIEGFGPTEIVKKIKNIRSTYSQEKRKIAESKKSGAATSDLYRPSLKWFEILNDALHLIVETTRKTKTNMDTDASQSEITEEATESVGAVEPINEVVEGSTTPLATREKTQVFNSTSKRRVHEIQHIVTELKGLNESINKSIEENEFEAFGHNIALQLQNMPIELALEAQQYIQTYLSRLRLQHLKGQKGYTPTASLGSSSTCSTESVYASLDKYPISSTDGNTQDVMTSSTKPSDIINEALNIAFSNDTTMYFD